MWSFSRPRFAFVPVHMKNKNFFIFFLFLFLLFFLFFFLSNFKFKWKETLIFKAKLGNTTFKTCFLILLDNTFKDKFCERNNLHISRSYFALCSHSSIIYRTIWQNNIHEKNGTWFVIFFVEKGNCLRTSTSDSFFFLVLYSGQLC